MYYTEKLHNLRFCIGLKIMLIIFHTPESEVLRITRKNSKIGGFASNAKTSKLGVSAGS